MTTHCRTIIRTTGTPFVRNDGGRRAAGYKGTARDCVCRAIAIATGQPYQDIYDELNDLTRGERPGRHNRKRSSARTGIRIRTIRTYLERLGWQWVPTMGIGTGCTVHLRPDELPEGRIIVSLQVQIDGVLHNTYDCSRGGTRCVYGYWRQPDQIHTHTGECP